MVNYKTCVYPYYFQMPHLNFKFKLHKANREMFVYALHRHDAITYSWRGGGYNR